MRADMIRRTTQFNFVMLIASLGLGGVSWILCLLTYNSIVDEWPRPFVIGVVFAILAFFVTLGVFAVSLLQGAFEENILNGGGAGSVLIAIFASTVLIAALGTLFQWIYGLHYDREPTEPTAYIFVIDDSGSMESNDPDQLRYAAVNKVLEKKPADFPYMIYGFSNQVSILREMMPISDGAMDITGNNRGGTCIKKVMNQVIADYQNHIWEGGEHPKVILFTDGHASDVGWFSSINKALKQFSKNHISVSAVGLGAVDYALMQKITAKTGGVFIDISDAAMLGDAMEDAANQYAADDLLTTRYSSRLNFLFGFLRILFLTILGACIGSVCAVTYGKTDAADFVILTSVIQSFAGALLMELLTSISGLSDRFCWFVLWMFIAAMLCTQNSGYRRGYARPSRGRGKSSSVLR